MDPWNVYANEHLTAMPTGSGPLDGLSFAIKDVFDIQGHTSSAGNPDWLRTHKAASHHASVVEQLLGQGARLRGTTITDELMFSINGENVHYGTPVNPADPVRIPGGSSSGSAVAVAAGLADFAIGTDTGGSVRVPASYCGVYGIRPTHGAVSSEGLIPLARSFDTVGWMARDARTLLDVGRVLLSSQGAATIDRAPSHGLTRLLIAEDMWELADSATRDALAACLPAITNLMSQGESITVASAPGGLNHWKNTFRIIQGHEIWREHGNWITETKPTFGADIGDRFRWASTIAEPELQDSLAVQQAAILRMTELLDEHTIIVAPTVPSIAPLKNGSGEDIELRRQQTFQLCCVAGLCGLPQVTMPIQGEGGLPIGISFIARQGHDLQLLQWLVDVSERLTKEQRL
ncbi:amidase [Paenibacillus sp. strain BS8-2]